MVLSLPWYATYSVPWRRAGTQFHLWNCALGFGGCGALCLLAFGFGPFLFGGNDSVNGFFADAPIGGNLADRLAHCLCQDHNFCGFWNFYACIWGHVGTRTIVSLGVRQGHIIGGDIMSFPPTRPWVNQLHADAAAAAGLSSHAPVGEPPPVAGGNPKIAFPPTRPWVNRSRAAGLADALLSSHAPVGEPLRLGCLSASQPPAPR